jgi:hypothetical protein
MSRPLPKLVRLYITQTLVGFGLSAAFVTLLLWGNVANLWHLVTHTSAGPLAVGLLWVFNGIVFSGVQFGISVMRMSEEGGRGGGRKERPQVQPALVPVPVKADEPPR